MERNVKLVIFDLDGTLVDAFKAVSQSVNHALTYMGYETLAHEVIASSVGWGERVLISRFVREGDLDKTLSVFRQHHRVSIKSGVKFLPGAKELIVDLKKKGYLIAIASNRPTRFAHMILKQLNIRDQFDYILCGDKVENPKPAGDLLVNILKKFLLSADQAIYVGDMSIDVQAGNNARVKTIAVTTGSHTYDDIIEYKPFAIVSRLKEVTDILDKADLSLTK